MSGPQESTVEVNGRPCRVWRAGAGEPLGYLPGFGGLLRWPPVLDRLAARRRVVAPSLPGFPGGLGHDQLDGPLDWALATRDLVDRAGLRGGDLIGVSVGGALAADLAAIWPDTVRRLVLISPLGLCDEAEPVADVFAQPPGTVDALLCAEPEERAALTAPPADADPAEWQIVRTRADEAAARLLWPLGDTGLAGRLGRIACPVLLLRGSEDRVLPASYLGRLAHGIAGEVAVREIPGAGHLAELDAPEAVAEAVQSFLDA